MQHFPSPITHIVADPQNSLVEGDVVKIASGWRTSKNVRHVVRIQERIYKDVRSAARGRTVRKLRLERAKKQGYEIPDLETAMANVKLAEEQEKAVREGGKGKAKMAAVREAHKGQIGQMETVRKRMQAKTTAERDAEIALKRAQMQKVPEEEA